MAPAPASKRMAAPVTWSSPVVEVLGPTGVFAGGEIVPMGVVTVGLTIGTVWVPDEREMVWLPIVTTVEDGQYVVKYETVFENVFGGLEMVLLTEIGGGTTDGDEVGG